jgi:membrane protease YdiL (CAAX protease family)
MRTRKDIMMEMIFVIGAVVLIPITVFIAKQFAVEPGQASNFSYMTLLPIIPMLYLGFKSSKWLVLSVEKFTGFKLVFFGWGMLFIFLAGLFSSIVVIPIGLFSLLMQYLRA